MTSDATTRRFDPKLLFAAIAVVPAALYVVLAVDHRWVDEDAFINLRVVRNILQGHGPVFNIGERVEAGTSALWVGILALAGALRLPLERSAAFLGIAFSVLGLVLAQIAAGRRTERESEGAPRTFIERLSRPALPLGALSFAILPAAWDYASSGLESGLTIGWLGSSYYLLSLSVFESPRWRPHPALTAVVIGLGPLVRPECAIYSAGFFGVYACDVLARAPFASALATITKGAFLALIAPVAYQLFRMGYYACTVPNTALAKEAFMTNWPQGKEYLENFYGTYKLLWVLPFFVICFLVRLREAVTAFSLRSAAEALFVAAPTVGAAIQATYLVSMGGDYMHGRLLVPVFFAALLPIATVPIQPPILRAGFLLRLGAALGVVPWAIYCGTRLRVGVDNVNNIGDERGWNVREATVKNPVTLAEYRKHSFFDDARKAMDVRHHACPNGGPTCRFTYVDDEMQHAAPIASEVDPRIDTVLSFGAIGISGFAVPDSVYVVDRRGLTDPIVARFELKTRARPGHEKLLTTPWMAGRYSAPSSDEDPDVTAARHALHCGALADLDRAVRGPLTAAAFWENLKSASTYSRLRIPVDSYEAEERFCGTPHRPEFKTSGGGGSPFRWLCHAGDVLAALHASTKKVDHALASVQPVCRVAGADAESVPKTGPLLGEKADRSFELACPIGQGVVGMYGTEENWVRRIGLVCSGTDEHGPVKMPLDGGNGGKAFSFSCPGNRPAVGVIGRQGALMDALGIVCPVP